MENTLHLPYRRLTEDQKHHLNMAMYDMIQDLPFKVDTPDLVDTLKTNLYWFDMDQGNTRTPLARGFLYYYVDYKNR